MAWNNVPGRTPPLTKTDCHVHENKHANEAVSTHHALCMQLHNTPDLVKYMFSSIGDTTYSRFRIAGPLQVFLFESQV